MSVNLGLFSQNITVTGKVTDTLGASLPGVNIALEVTQQGPVFDVDGI
jgi:hypothetical protein